MEKAPPKIDNITPQQYHPPKIDHVIPQQDVYRTCSQDQKHNENQENVLKIIINMSNNHFNHFPTFMAWVNTFATAITWYYKLLSKMYP